MNSPNHGRWRLPDGIEEVLPEAAWRLEHLRNDVLALYSGWGYDLVIPPLIEYLDSLLIGAGHDLDLDTCKLVDQVSGRMMGVRADMTPQVARIDAHRLAQRLDREAPTRLCYLGAVLHARPGPFGGSRSPLQLGAELYGHGGMAADLEVLELLLATLTTVGIESGITLDLGHVGIVSGIADHCGLEVHERERMIEMLQRKSLPEVEAYLGELDITVEQADMWRALGSLHGDRGVLADARTAFAGAGPEVVAALDHLDHVGERIGARVPGVALHFDPAELRGYHYHTGMVFAVYIGDTAIEIARGGRYDGIGKAFGRARPATGFSTDLRLLAEFGSGGQQGVPAAIAAPADDDSALAARIRELRAAGERVIVMLPGQDADEQDMGCDRRLIRSTDDWQLEEI